MSHLLSPTLRTIFSVLVQASPWSTFVKYTYPDKSWEVRSCALDFVLSGRCWCCNGPLGGRKGRVTPYSKSTWVYICTMLELERYRIQTMLVLSHFILVAFSTSWFSFWPGYTWRCQNERLKKAIISGLTARIKSEDQHWELLLYTTTTLNWDKLIQ